jgi:hypothetical protein
MVGALSFARPIVGPRSILPPVSIFSARMRRGRRGSRLVERIGPGPPAIVAPTIAFATGVTGASAGARTMSWSSRRLKLVRRLVPTVILRLDVRDMEKSISTNREVDERGLNCRLEIDNLPLVDIARIALVAGPLDVQFLEDAVLDDGNPAFLGLKYIDQHFFFHAVSFRNVCGLQSHCSVESRRDPGSMVFGSGRGRRLAEHESSTW